MTDTLVDVSDSIETAGGSFGTGSAVPDTSRESKRFFAVNTASQAVFFIFNAVTSLFMVPYLINHLGISEYGIVTLANKVVAWTQFLSTAVVSMISRFVLIQLSRGDVEAARKYYSTQFLATVFLCCALLPLVALISYLSPLLFNIPESFASGGRIMFSLTYGSFLLMMVYTALQTAVYVRQKFYIRNVLEILNQVVRYSAWIALFALMAPSLWHVGIGYVLGSLVAVVGAFIAFGRLTPELKPAYRVFDAGKFREMTSFGGWMVLGQAGLMLYNRSDAAILTWTLGLASVGMYGAVSGFVDMLRNFTASFLGIIGPSVVSGYGRGDYDGCLRIITRASKFLSCGIGTLMGVLAGLALPLLSWWLGPEYSSLHVVVWVLFASIALNTPTEPMATLLNAANRVSVLAVSNIGGGVLHILLCLAFLRYTRLGLCSIPVALVISNAVKNLVVFPVYSSRVLGKPIWAFYRPQLPSALVFGIVFAATLWVSRFFTLTSFPRLAVLSLFLLCIFGLAIYTIVLNADDRRFLRETIPLGKRRKAGIR